MAAFDDTDLAEILGQELPNLDAVTGGGGKGTRKTTGREAILEFFGQRWREGDRGPVPFGEIGKNVSAVKTRALTNALKKLVTERLLCSDGGFYMMTEEAAALLGVDDKSKGEDDDE
ncbi:hypothetical protein [Pilimelia columellifera]|uniref:Uncharacterized protein n=1 Tax=Pilimelia columellifera subsp. columellifera TaxID=706583 RepID=A0ABP6B1P7_9ACTN